jgi:hypothetical protein
MQVFGHEPPAALRLEAELFRIDRRVDYEEERDHRTRLTLT